jgi:hypothetical protein
LLRLFGDGINLVVRHQFDRDNHRDDELGADKDPGKVRTD